MRIKNFDTVKKGVILNKVKDLDYRAN